MHRSHLARLAGGISVLLMLALATAAWSAAPPKNLLENPGFESGLAGHPWMPAGWDTSRAGLTSVFFGRDSFLVHSGSFAVSVANVSGLWPLAHNWSRGLLIPKEWWGKDAVFSIWTKSVGVNGRAYALIQAFRDTASRMALTWGVDRDSALHLLNIKKIDDPLLDLGWQRQNFSDAESDWVRRQVRVYIAPSTNVLFVRFGLFGTGQVVFDDASLTLEPAEKPAPLPVGANLLRDPSFEEGGDAWEYSMPPYEGTRAFLDSTTAHTGRFSATITGGDNAWIQARTGVCQAIPNRGFAGKHVKLTGWVKTDSLRTLAYMKLYAHTLHGVESAPVGPVFSGTEGWKQAMLEMDMPADTYEVWAWFAFNGPAPSGLLWFDDLSLEVTGPATGGKRDRTRTRQ